MIIPWTRIRWWIYLLVYGSVERPCSRRKKEMMSVLAVQGPSATPVSCYPRNQGVSHHTVSTIEPHGVRTRMILTRPVTPTVATVLRSRRTRSTILSAPGIPTAPAVPRIPTATASELKGDSRERRKGTGSLFQVWTLGGANFMEPAGCRKRFVTVC